MMLHPLLDQIRNLKLTGMLEALEGQLKQSDIGKLSFEERLSLLISYEASYRENKRLKRRFKAAKLRSQACFEDIDFKTTRQLDRSAVMSLESCKWLQDKRNILITGATGTGKSFLAEAFAHKACLKGFSVQSLRLSRFLDELILARAEGTHVKRLLALSKIDLVVFDDFGLSPFKDEQRRDLLEILDDRYKKKSTIITSQLEVKHWHAAIGDATLADAILDRLVHNSYRFELKGPTLRSEGVA